jgi:hypothetical protein
VEARATYKQKDEAKVEAQSQWEQLHARLVMTQADLQLNQKKKDDLNVQNETRKRRVGEDLENYNQLKRSLNDESERLSKIEKETQPKEAEARQKLDATTVEEKKAQEALTDARAPYVKGKADIAAKMEAEKPGRLFKLKDGSKIEAISVIDAGDAFAVKGKDGKIVLIKKADIEE